MCTGSIETRAAFPSRQRHHELRALREDVARLQTRLAQLRSLHESKSKATGELAWEAVAKCQRQRRKDAEVANAQLRVLLAKQRRIARRLQKMLAKRCWDEPVWWEKGEDEPVRNEGSYGGVYEHEERATEYVAKEPTTVREAELAESPPKCSLVKSTASVGGDMAAKQALAVALALRSVYGAIWFHTTHRQVALRSPSTQKLATGAEEPKQRAFHVQHDSLDDHRAKGMDSESIRRVASDDATLTVETLERWGLMLPCALEFAMQESATEQLPQLTNDFSFDTSFIPSGGFFTASALSTGFGDLSSSLVC